MENLRPGGRNNRFRTADDTRVQYARFLDAAHQQLNGPVVLVWDNLNTHVSRAMAELVAARSWLTLYRLPPYASELNPVELGPLAVVQCSRDGARVQAELLAEHGEIVVAGVAQVQQMVTEPSDR